MAYLRGMQTSDHVCFFPQDRCIKVVDTAADKSGAESTCGSGGSPFSGPGKLFAPKSRSEQQDLEQFLKRKSVTDEIYLGMTKNGDGQVCLLTQYIFLYFSIRGRQTGTNQRILC